MHVCIIPFPGENTFFHPVGCLLILFMLPLPYNAFFSFLRTKLLSLIRFHVFIPAFIFFALKLGRREFPCKNA